VLVKVKNTATEAALKEVKDRSKTAAKTAVTKSPHGHMASVPKHQKSATFNARGGAKR